ncbi:hypothetical protein CEXT_250011 [Caerostris extrusa]|uniref:Uncharacterized protein n=1 Tax=Caerostris extrusa TaxID=172846 RepID=A0AAV4XGL0_CAEEX|nr:hypothetical protein CEXT_250011 [Caerostris extrusa]
MAKIGWEDVYCINIYKHVWGRGLEARDVANDVVFPDIPLQVQSGNVVHFPEKRNLLKQNEKQWYPPVRWFKQKLGFISNIILIQRFDPFFCCYFWSVVCFESGWASLSRKHTRVVL